MPDQEHPVPSNPAEPGATEAVVEEQTPITPALGDLGELATHHDDLENPDAELSDALSVDSLSMTTFKPQLRIN